MTARDLHDLHRAAALRLISDWILAGCNSLALVAGRIESLAGPPAAGTWDIADEAALRVFIATVFAGQRYRGWGRAYRQAERAAR